MSNLQTCYSKILNLLHEIEAEDYYLNQIRLPQLTDKELIALTLAAESLGIDSERYLFKRLPPELQGKIERSEFNRRKRHLACKIGQIQQSIAAWIVPAETYHLIDIMPLETCKLSRAYRSKSKEDTSSVYPDYGYCAAQKMHYFGYKIHAVCTLQGVFKAFDTFKAN